MEVEDKKWVQIYPGLGNNVETILAMMQEKFEKSFVIILTQMAKFIGNGNLCNLQG